MEYEQMLIYDAEKKDGINDLKLSFASIHPFLLSQSESEWKITTDKLLDIKKSFSSFKQDIDLYPVFDILVSTGWNKNDEYFSKDQVLLARGSSINKPFNIGHNPVRIIGHIFGDNLVDNDFNILENNENLPDKFHVLTGSVIYTQKQRGRELEQEVSTLIEQIENGEWFVSVEALFPKFHYILSNEQETKIIERKEETAFLSKYLRILGGSGVYENYRIGRYLLNIVFSGKGLVHKPANVNSIILNQSSNNNNGDKIMAEEVKRDFEGEIKTLQTEIETLKTQNSKIDELTKQNEELVKANEELKKTTEDQKNVITQLTADATKSAETLKSLNGELETVRKQNSDFSLQIKTINRVSKLVDKGVEKTQAEDLVNKLISVEDGVFDIMVATQAELVAAKTAKPKEDTKVEPEVEIANAGTTEIEKTEPEVEPALIISDEIKIDENVKNDIAKFLGQE